jgi:hypothetical protein
MSSGTGKGGPVNFNGMPPSHRAPEGYGTTTSASDQQTRNRSQSTPAWLRARIMVTDSTMRWRMPATKSHFYVFLPDSFAYPRGAKPAESTLRGRCRSLTKPAESTLRGRYRSRTTASPILQPTSTEFATSTPQPGQCGQFLTRT